MKATGVLLVFVLAAALAAEDMDATGVRIAMKVYEDCSSRSDGFSPCLKKKAITFLDRLARMEHISLSEGIVINKAENATPQDKPMTEEQIETSLPRAADARDDALTNMLMDKISNFVGSRSIEVTLPKISEMGLVEEGRKKSGGGGGGGMKGMMGGMMMGIAAKMAALIPIAIAGLFLLAGKALITAKIALLISGIIAIKKLFGNKGGGGGGGGHGWQSGGGGGGWQSSGGGGGWDKRSLDESQKLAYKGYAPK